MQVRSERDALAYRLQRLEEMLADPEKAQNAILYYRLRAIWNLCHNDLMTLAKQFRKNYADRCIADVGEAVNKDRIELATRLREASAEAKVLRERERRVRQELYGRAKPFKPGEKAALTRELKTLELRLKASRRRIAELRHDAAVIPPPTPRTGLTIATRRAINTVLIALAQHYYLLYREEQISEMALRAARKSVDEVYFGLSSECLELGQKARELVAQAKRETNRHESVRRRAQYLNEHLRYASKSAAIPLMDSVKQMPTRIAAGADVLSNFSEQVPVNVLSQDYWDLARALLS